MRILSPRNRPAASALVFLVCLTLAGGAAFAEEAPAAAAESPWRVEATMWLWLLGMEGDVGIGATRADVSADFGDILEASDSLLAFSGRLEIGRGRFAGFIDGIYTDVGVDNASGSGGAANIDISLPMAVVDLGVMYRVYDGQLLGDRQPADRPSTIDVYAGARYFWIELELDPAAGPTRSRERDWFDPIVGVKLRQPIGERFHIDIWGDVGGFGVESDLTWSATAVVGYDFTAFGSVEMSVYAGYRAIGWDHVEGSGPSRFEWDMILHGPTLGFQARF